MNNIIYITNKIIRLIKNIFYKERILYKNYELYEEDVLSWYQVFFIYFNYKEFKRSFIPDSYNCRCSLII